MPFIPHTQADIDAMLAEINAKHTEDLFDEIPEHLRVAALSQIPEGMNEMEFSRLMQQRAQQDHHKLCFIGAGAYEHHIPAAVWDIVGRGEFMTAYTPYQAEASQGTLQLLYEYQSMMAHLMGMEVSNASLYDGGSALAEAVLMAVRANRQVTTKRVLLLGAIHPYYLKTMDTIVKHQKIEWVHLPFDATTGRFDVRCLAEFDEGGFAAVVVQQPNFLGLLEEVDAVTDWAHKHHALLIASVNPTAMALFKEPGQWGKEGADIVCGEGQPLGIPLASGGPYFGFLCCKQAYVRHMPGRLIGRTVDIEGKQGFALTLQAREQHIRRSKATSNICTNQGLLVTAATIYMSLLGSEGLKQVALASYQATAFLRNALSRAAGAEVLFQNQPHFHETVLRLPVSVSLVQHLMAERGIQAGFDLSTIYPELGQALLICATETKTEEDLHHFVAELQACLEVAKNAASRELA